MTAEPTRDLLFLGGLGAPTQIYTPWFIAFQRRGYRVHVVPNSFLCLEPVSTFAESFVKLSAQFDSFDVLGVSYGGNAALFGAYLSDDICEKAATMVLVCSPVLGVPLLTTSLGKVLSSRFPKHMTEMYEDSDISNHIKEESFHERIAFDLHCLYHPRDLTAPERTATLPGVSTDHALGPDLLFVPRLLIHEAACVNPETLRTIYGALGVRQ